MNKLYYTIKANPNKTTQELIKMLGFDFRYTTMLHDLVMSEKIQGSGIYIDSRNNKHVKWKVR